MATWSSGTDSSPSWCPLIALGSSGTIWRADLQSLQHVRHQPVPDVHEPGQDLVPGASEDILIKEDQLPRQNGEDKSDSRVPVLPDEPVILYSQQGANLSVETGLQGAQELQLDEINPARLVEAMRDFHPAPLQVELAIEARGKDHVIVGGLHLYPVAASLAAVIALGRRQAGGRGPRFQAVADTVQPLEVIAGGREGILAEELMGGMEFRRSTGGPR